MSILVLGSLTGALLGWLMGFSSLFLIMLILVQRGRGGGLTGALGGPGGQSAFGSKSGDMFTTITIGVAIFWGLVCAVTILVNTTPTTLTAEDKNVPGLSAGPKDAETTDTDLTMPTSSGLEGISGLSGIGTPAADTETPAATPADASANTAGEAETAEPTDETEASTDAEETETPAASE